MTSTNEKQIFLSSLRGMVDRQKRLLFAEFEKEQALARQQFEELVEQTLSIKEKQMNAFFRELEMSDEPLNRGDLAQCRQVQSLLSLKYVQGRSATPGSPRSAGYIQSCTAAPEELFFLEDYRLIELKKSDIHRVYYECPGSYDPCLISFLTGAVRDESDKELNSSNRDLLNGMYLLEFVTTNEGTYSVHVTLYSQHIRGSPFHIVVGGDSVTEESKPPVLGWKQPELGDGPTQIRQPLRTGVQEPSREVAHRWEMRDDALGRRPEQPPFGPANLEIPPWRPEMSGGTPVMHHKPNNLGASVNAPPKAPPKAVFPQEQPASGFSTAPTVAGRTSAPKPSKRNVSTDAGSHLGTPGAKSCIIPNVKTALEDLFCDPGFEGYERQQLSHPSSVSSSASMVECSAPPVESTRKEDPPKRSFQPVKRAPPKKGTFSAEFILQFRDFKHKKFAFPIGVTATAQNVVILADTGNHNVLMFNCEAQPLGQANLPRSLGGFKRPSAVVAQDDGTFAVKDDNCIYVFSKDGQYIRTLGKGVLSRPYGLALEGRENLLTLSLGESPPALRSYSMSGDFETVKAYEPIAPRAPSNSKCRFMEVHGKDLFVSDLGLSYIYKTSLHGEQVKSFGGRGTNPGRLNEPSDLCATENYLFVGDSKNNRIQVFDFDGNFISVVKIPETYPVIRPSGLYVSPEYTLYVTNYLKATVSMYQLTFQGKP